MLPADELPIFLDHICHQAAVEPETVSVRKIARSLKVGKGKTALLNQQEGQLVFVARGATKLVAHASAGREQVVAFHFAGDLISIPARSAHSYSLTALSDTSLLTFTTQKFLNAVNDNPAALREIITRVMGALHRSRDKAVNLGRKTAQERVASFLVSMAERIGTSEAGNLTCFLPMSRRDIGDSLGLTIETVSRQFTELRGLGLIETSGRSQVRIHDLRGLTERAGHPADALCPNPAKFALDQ